MRGLLTSLPRHLQRMRLAYLVLTLSLIPTAMVYYRVRFNVEARERTRFERLVTEEKTAIEQRIPHYVDEMMGIRGLFAANSEVTSNQWEQYLESIEIQTLYPGIRTLGYIEQVKAEDLPAFLAHRGAQGVSGLKIIPDNERPVYYPDVYVTHFDPDLHGGEGRDHSMDPQRRPFMEAARDTGLATATGKLILGQNGTNGGKRGFVIYLPVYRAGLPTASIVERQAALQGFIFANFESDALMKGIFGAQRNIFVDCDVFDGKEISRENLLYDYDNVLGYEHNRAQHLRVPLPVLNRIWTLYFSSLPLFDAETQSSLPLVALFGGLFLSFLLFVVTFGEVNARARSEKIMQELRRSETALAAEKERLAVTLYSIGDGVITTNTAGFVLSVNKVAEQLVGWTQAEALGKPLGSFFKIVDAGTREGRPNPLETALQTGAASGLEQPSILTARDGSERVITDSAAPIRGRDGGIVGAVLVFRDVTARQKSEAEMLKESKLESVGLLAGGIAHDFNNILQGIIGNLSLARMNAHSTEKLLERLASVEKSTMRAKDLTQQLVMFARGGAPIRKCLEVTHIVKDTTMLALTGGNVHCEFSLAADVWPVEVDAGQFRQVINNIVLNATQAMPDGGKIEVRTENVEFTAGFLPPLAGGKFVKITIRDHGTGIRPENLPRIFDPYFTTRKHARGLGLASAYSVIRKHDGQINVETQLGRGTAFQIYLPASVKETERPILEMGQRSFFGQGRVLVMDDEAEILMLVREMLELMGYEVEVARDGAEALQRYLAAKRGGTPFSVVIMDLTVPEGMGGKEAIRRLREVDPQVKAIVSSGYSYDPVMANFREYGFSGVIPKPYIMEELGRVVDDVIKSPVAGPSVAQD